MLWLGLLGEEATIIHHVPALEDDADTRPEELAEAAVLHGCRPSPWRREKNLLVASAAIVVVVVIA